MEKAGTFSKQALLVTLLAAIAVSLMNIVNPLISIGVAAAATAVLFLLQRPVYSIVLVILAIPFSATKLLDSQLAGVPGMKLTNLLVVAAIGFLLLSKKPYELLKKDRVFIYGLIIIFTIAVLRSTTFIGETYNMIWEDQYSLPKFLLSHLIRPLLIFVPFILIVSFVRSREDVKKIAVATMASIMLLAVVILFLYAFFTPNKANFEAVRMGFKGIMGMHGNNLADFFIAVYPMLLAYAVSKRHPVFIGGVVVSLCAVGVLYSRTAYLVVILCTFAFFLVSGRKKILPLILGAALAGYAFVPQTIIQRALTGLGDNNVNDISAGRVSDIWTPLFNEFLAQPQKLIAGAGRYAVMGTNAFKNGLMLQVGHAHSMYFDTLFDSGIIGLGFFLVFFFLFLKRFIKAHPQIRDRAMLDILIGIEISVVSFLIRGVTDSFFFPTLTNAFLWINLGLGISIVYSCTTGEGKSKGEVTDTENVV